MFVKTRDFINKKESERPLFLLLVTVATLFPIILFELNLLSVAWLKGVFRWFLIYCLSLLLPSLFSKKVELKDTLLEKKTDFIFGLIVSMTLPLIKVYCPVIYQLEKALLLQVNALFHIYYFYVNPSKKHFYNLLFVIEKPIVDKLKPYPFISEIIVLLFKELKKLLFKETDDEANRYIDYLKDIKVPALYALLYGMACFIALLDKTTIMFMLSTNSFELKVVVLLVLISGLCLLLCFKDAACTFLKIIKDDVNKIKDKIVTFKNFDTGTKDNKVIMYNLKEENSRFMRIFKENNKKYNNRMKSYHYR